MGEAKQFNRVRIGFDAGQSAVLDVRAGADPPLGAASGGNLDSHGVCLSDYAFG